MLLKWKLQMTQEEITRNDINRVAIYIVTNVSSSV